MYLTATYNTRANDHDRCRLDAVRRRWHHAFTRALAQPRNNQPELHSCIVRWTSKDGARTKLVVDEDRLHEIVRDACPAVPHLHSSARMSMIVALQELLGSYLAIRADWINSDRRGPAPTFPRIAPASEAEWRQEWEGALEQSHGCGALSEESAWRARVTTAAKRTVLPIYFGAAPAGGHGVSYCGMLRREDGRWFALLAAFPQGDKLGSPVQRAGNRQHLAPAVNPNDARPIQRGERKGEERGIRPFEPSDRMRCALMLPLEMDARQERLYLERATPKSAELIPARENAANRARVAELEARLRGPELDARAAVQLRKRIVEIQREDGWRWHVASEIEEPAAPPDTGVIMSLRRGIRTLVSGVVVDAAGRRRGVVEFSDAGLATTITAIRKNRATKQAKGIVTHGDRRAAAITEEQLYLIAHAVVRVARRYGVSRIVMLADPFARAPQRMLGWKHFSRCHELLATSCRRAGLPVPTEEPLRPPYVKDATKAQRQAAAKGWWSICLRCGWRPGDPVRREQVLDGQCGACGRMRNPEYHLADLLAEDTRRRAAKSELSLPNWIRYRHEE